MKTISSYLLTGLLLLGAASCSNSGFKKTKSGLLYKIYSNGQGAVAKKGEFLKAQGWFLRCVGVDTLVRENLTVEGKETVRQRAIGGDHAAQVMAVQKYPTMATKWLRKARDLEPSVSLICGIFCEVGTGVRRDLKRAKKFYKRSANSGNALALSHLQRL